MGRFEKEENGTSRNGKPQITEIESLADSVDSRLDICRQN